jgi:5'-3' exonuclease
MELENLLEDVEEQKDEGKLFIDADSMIFMSCFKHKDSQDDELAYMDFIKILNRIETEVWKKYQLIETKIGITSSTNFRYKLYSDYKANRKQKNEDAELLSQFTKRVKKLIYDRLKPILVCDGTFEADDHSIYYSKQGWIVACIDSDVVGQSRSPVFNYHSKHWCWVHDGLDEDTINTNILIDSIAGKSKDNVVGVKGLGKAKANTFIEQLNSGNKTFSDYVDLFDTPEDMLLSYQLCDCGQIDDNGKLKLVSVADIEDRLIPF